MTFETEENNKAIIEVLKKNPLQKEMKNVTLIIKEPLKFEEFHKMGLNDEGKKLKLVDMRVKTLSFHMHET